MKRSLVAALLSVALLAETPTTTQAGGFGISLNLNLNLRGNGWQPPPGWSGSYPRPVMYGGLFASMPCQNSCPPPSYGYPPFQGNYGGYNQGYGWTQQAPVQAPATPGISTVWPSGPLREVQANTSK